MVSFHDLRHSLKARITLAMLAVFLGCLWALSLHASRILREDMERLLGHQQLTAATTVAAQIDHELALRRAALEEAAQRAAPYLRAGPGSVQFFLEQRFDLHVLFNGGSYVTGQDGVAFADYPLSSGRNGTNYLDREYVAVPLREGRSVIGQPVIGKRAGVPVVVMGVPIRDGGEVVGALTGVINLGLPSFIDRITEHGYGTRGGYLLVAPRYRMVISATEKGRFMETLPRPGALPKFDHLLSGYEESLVLVNPRGEEVLASSSSIPTAGWYLIAQVPTEDAFAPIRAMQDSVIGAALLLTLLAAALTWWILNRQLSPLLATADALAAMDPSRPAGPLPIARHDEIGRLIAGFNRLLAVLGEREQALRDGDETLRSLLDTTLDGYWRIDSEARLLDVNPAYCRNSGYAREELLRMRIPQLDAEQSEQQVLALIQTILERGNLQFPTVHRRKDGSLWHVEVSATARDVEAGEIIVFLRDIDERVRAEDDLRRSEASFRGLFEKNASILLYTDPEDGTIVDANAAASRYYGYPREQLKGMNISVINTLAPERIAEARRQAVSSESNTFQFVHRLASGELRDVEVHLTPIDVGKRTLLFSIVHDITERKRAEERQQLAASVFTFAREGILITDPTGTIVDVNDSFTRITGYSREEAIGMNPRMLASGRHGAAFYTAMWRDLLDKNHWYGEVWNRRKNGEIYAEMLTISAVRDSEGRSRHFVALFSDITALKEHEKQLEHIAHYDVLTTLPNRVLLADRLHHAMAIAQRHRQPLAVAYLDLDGFKAVNDRHGHETGDQLLVTLAARMKQTLREVDTLARIGGDEFVAVLSDLADPVACTPLLNRLLAAVAQPVEVGEFLLQVSGSVGVTFFPQAEDVDADQLLRQADQAMYQAKLAGKNRYHFFDAEQDRSVRGLHESIEHIRRGLSEDEFVLHYQPKVNMRTGQVIGAEALIRWQHPERGLLAPGVFLPVIEDHPLTVELGEWVIEAALRQRDEWLADGFDLPISVNIGARQLQQIDFVPRLRELLAAHPGTRPGHLELEVLETSALEDLDRVAQVIEECQEIGVSFALDDFGTGYSSLTYLKRLSVNQLKIDKSFVRDMLDDPDDLAILGGVLSLATAFRRQVIAEGVETVGHGTMLLQLGCEFAQGYGIARPMPAAELPAWAAAWQPDGSWSRVPPTSRDDLPILFASVEHRAWLTALENYIAGRRDALPLSHYQCSFAAWLDTEGRAQHGENPHFGEIVSIHDRLHELGSDMLVLHASGRSELALARLDELQALRDALLEGLRKFTRDSS